jgi:hypothetical protein
VQAASKVLTKKRLDRAQEKQIGLKPEMATSRNLTLSPASDMTRETCAERNKKQKPAIGLCLTLCKKKGVTAMVTPFRIP